MNFLKYLNAKVFWSTGRKLIAGDLFFMVGILKLLIHLGLTSRTSMTTLLNLSQRPSSVAFS